MADEKLKKIVYQAHPNEYVCHVAFVYKIALDLQKRFGGNRRVIAAAALLHDHGRGHHDKPHQELGAALARKILKKLNYQNDEIEQVVTCILNHSARASAKSSIEEKIVSSADGAAQVIYSPLFGLLSKKEPCEKSAWVLKHLAKGFAKISLPEFKQEVAPFYQQLKSINCESVKVFRSITK
ncbi:MAG: HD domain-containing protein [Patescibacteria group bacterium]|nr:HD domain-containing protein [Patescibacteria group bacterium]